MNILLIVLAVIVGLIVLVLILAAFTRKGYVVSRDIIINRPKREVYDYVKMLKNQDDFSKWVKTDPDMKRVFTGVDGTIGFKYAWDGNKQAGEGEQEIKALVEGEKVDIEVRFIRPFKAIAQTPFTIESVSANQAKLTWTMVSEMKYPMNAIMLFMNMENMLGKDMDISLANVKTILEN